MQDIAHNLDAVRERIAAAAVRAGRDPKSVHLMAVSKAQPLAAVESAWGLGQADFGENYLQDAMPKLAAFAGRPAVWHFIGALQSNKSREVATRFQWLHTLDRDSIARRLSEQRPASLPPLQVCLQVNVSGESSKGGVMPERTAALADAVAGLANLKLRGLMAIPAPAKDIDAQRRPFRALRELLEELRRHGHELDTLSMGMSDDLEAAVLEGATIVRVGTAIFGARPPKI
ncbi:MAG TPA: YggS family pyridoxal phosphate-dependent enzyme [Gammaproteobacteria bacterium]|nr:YggS family pyridoxal phosphate-dependent enzyme [Gammaproteobacteria bacterium]